MKEIIILGTGGNCIDILDAVLELNRSGIQATYHIRGFLDDNDSDWGKDYFGYKVLGPLSMAAQLTETQFVNGIGSPRNFWKKKDIIARTGVTEDRFETIIHPRAAVSAFASVGRGSVILPNATLSARVHVGRNVIILPNAIVSHDVSIGDYTCVASAACLAGGVHVSESCYIGANSSVNNNVKLGRYSLIGMGATVLKDIPENSVAVGNPARVIRNVF
jgi:sugar O-acyltransferase (sialic acid O-acetyltransferase NeuD family)